MILVFGYSKYGINFLCLKTPWMLHKFNLEHTTFLDIETASPKKMRF